MRMRPEALMKILLNVFLLLSLLTACPSQSFDHTQPVLTVLGETERSIQVTSLILEGELEDDQPITAFSYRLNDNPAQDVLAYLDHNYYRFVVPNLREGANTLTLLASNASMNTSQQRLIIHVVPKLSRTWLAHTSYSACSKTSGATFKLDMNEGKDGYIQGAVTLKLEQQDFFGVLSGSREEDVLQGGLSLQNTLGQSLLGQFRFNHEGSNLDGQASFKAAIPCSSSHSEDLHLTLTFTPDE